jgi:hypothetical protein
VDTPIDECALHDDHCYKLHELRISILPGVHRRVETNGKAGLVHWPDGVALIDRKYPISDEGYVGVRRRALKSGISQTYRQQARSSCVIMAL